MIVSIRKGLLYMINKYLDKYLQELFSYPVGEMRKVGSGLDGSGIYTSDSMIESFIEGMRDSHKSKSLESVVSLIKKEKVIIGYLNDNVISYYAFKLFGDINHNHIGGYYDIRNGKIYILMDNAINGFGHADNNELSDLLLHEILHMVAHSKPKEYYKIFQKYVDMFYYVFFLLMFNLDQKKTNKSNDYLHAIHGYSDAAVKRETHGGPGVHKYINKVMLPILSKLTLYSKDDFTWANNVFVDFLHNYFGDISKVRNNREYYNNIGYSFYNAYTETFGGETYDSFYGQELLIPSEIICMSSMSESYHEREDLYNKVISIL